MRFSEAAPILAWVGAIWLGWVVGFVVSQNSDTFPRSRSATTETNFGFTQTTYNGSIYEISAIKVYVQTTRRMGIQLTHPADVDMEYSIIEGDPNNIFKAEVVTVKDFSFLRIRTQTLNYWMLNRELNALYNLRVKARASFPGDITLVNYTNVIVTVLDINEFSPLFPSTPYVVSIPENTPLYQSIGQVKASDADSGINGEIYYSLVPTTQEFTVHPTTGIVSLTRPLSYDKKQEYELEVLAQDRGDPTQSRSISPNSKTKFKVSVLPVNFNSPTISIHNHQSLIEHGNIGSVFAVLTITDEDRGINGEIGRVAIANDPRRMFQLASDSVKGKYNIMVTSPIDRETMPENYNITVTAVDKGAPPKTSTAVIPVRVQDINDNEPEFEKSVYTVEISEIVPPNTPVLFVKAHDKDLGANAQVLYSIVDGNKNELFSIDPESGLIRTSGQLDAEADMRISLIVQAQDQANSGSRKTGQARVIILLKDYNDNAPIFHMSQNYVNVKENLPRGSRVTTVVANDEDSGDNGKLSYSIVNYDSVPFEIDAFTGEIITKDVLDYETMRRNYDLHLRVFDWGSPFRRSEDVVLTVRLEDVNDNSPEFERIRCSGYLSRESPLQMDIVTLTAIDFDSGNIITYSIIDGNSDDCFSLASSTGIISVNCDLSNSYDEIRTLTVVASDGQHVSIPTTVTLTLVNNNRNPALASDHKRVSCQKTDVTLRLQQQMQKSKAARLDEQIVELDRNRKQKNSLPVVSNALQTYAEVSESAEIGSIVLDFGKHVNDLDNGFNGQLTFVISSGNDPHGAFKLDSFTGKLQVLSRLDFEEKSEYTLTLTAIDLGQPPLQVSRDVRIVVLDENDNVPAFEKPLYTISISESTLIDSVVLQVKATDLDSGPNSEIRYTIKSDSGYFSIDSVQGIIKVKKALDRETTPTQILIIQAEDLGLKTRLSSTTTLNITITDINDNVPLFARDKYTLRVREDLPVGTLITSLSAHDLDEGDNARVVYSISHSNDPNFDIDNLTGSIRIKQTLDYEVKQVHNITVVALDGGQPVLTSTCLVTIEVLDVNENHFAPMFPDFIANGTVAENLPVGSYVMHVQAEDQDDPDTGVGQVYYTIQDGSGVGRFSIDANGTIRTSQVLDRETTPHYWLTIIAQDRALVPQFARLEVLIEVADVNEKIPQSVEPAYYASVEENRSNVTRVVQIQATDGDADGAQPLLFSITSGNPQNLFSIDPYTGVISTTNRMLDREKQDEHALEVTITDQGNPPLSSTTRVVIKVIDDNDNRPEFLHGRRQQITAFATPYTGKDIFIYRAVAYDADEGMNAAITYSLKSSRESQFRIDPDTGKIYSTEELRRGEYDLLVRATDNGANPRKSQMRLDIDVVARSSSTRSRPRFTQAVYEESITESDTPGPLIVLLSAENEVNEKLRYSIEGGNEEDKFTIQPDHGSIFLAETVDWETKSSYNLTVAVTDGVNSDFATVLVTVTDVNDNEPVFTHKLYRATISENAELGSSVLIVTATDQDRSKTLLYTIESAASTRSLDKFAIGANNGLLVLSGSLDREVLSRHLLTIMVRDNGIPSKRSYARVEINILDHNDHIPRFLYEAIESQVYESAALGTSVVQVMAMDRDKGHNAELAYAIVSGNADNTFTIDEHMGIISVAKELDQSTHSRFEMVVSATDHGEPPLTGTTKVKVMVTVSTNSPPRFIQNAYSASIKENLPPNTIVTSLMTECLSTVIYAISSGDEEGYFNINPNSGVITTMKPIDYEKNQSFNLTVSASNIISASQAVNVFVHIIDINDNAPRFLYDMYVGNISESALPGSMVLDNSRLPLVIQAADLDANNNARLLYQITDNETLQYFSIDPNTGALRTVATLDFETKNMFNFSVTVSDLGTPQLQALQNARVIIYLTDSNDNSPRFTQDIYQADVILPTFSDVSVLHVEADDPDTVFDKPLSYNILNGNDEEVFFVDAKEGTIFVQKDILLKEKYDLSVQASDGKFTTTARVVISVKQGETTLKFTRERYTSSVMENTASVIQLTIIQPVGLDPDSHVTFTLLNNLEYFSVGQTSGVLSTTGLQFDRETKDNYTVVVRIKVDDARTKDLSANVVVLVDILDENDNPPMFVNLPYHCTVSGDAKEGEVIHVVRATDPDIGENGEVKYTLADTNGNRFAINSYTREVVVKQLKEKDYNTEVVLKIVAQDRGSPSLSAVANIHVHITDSSSPLFEQASYEASVPENAAPHTPVIAVKAISPHGQKLIYSISRGDKYGEFALDFSTGYLSVADLLDYETTKTYQLTVRAIDVFTASYAETEVIINVEDVNDNPPVFSAPFYSHILSESSPVGIPVLTVSTTDTDSSANALVHYDLAPITPGSRDPDYFLINTQTGEIILKKELDYEKQKEFKFLVVARDGGMPVLSSLAQINVKVADINDNGPAFTQPSYSCFISDSASLGHLVFKAMALDPDESDAKNLLYRIVEGDDNLTFKMDSSTGIISLSTQPGHVLSTAYTLNVSVTDGVFTSFAIVSVTVRNINHYTPTFDKTIYNVVVPESQKVGTTIVTVVAFDEDRGTYGMTTYSIVSDEMSKIFSIDVETGEITLKQSLDREEHGMYNFTIAVTDSGGRMGFSKVVVRVQDENDNVPQFLMEEYRLNVAANASIGTTVIRIKAEDRDERDNAKLVYTLHPGEDPMVDKLFDVNPNSGLVTTKATLTTAENQVFQFFVRARDHGVPVRENLVPVEILVMSSNNVPPKFADTSRLFLVDENEQVGTIIATVKARSMVPLKYSIIPGFTNSTNRPMVFSIDVIGQLRLLQQLDRETTPSYTLFVRAETKSSPPLMDYLEIIVQVRDVNDNMPVFTCSPYVASLPENSRPQHSIIQLEASDLDLEDKPLKFTFGPGMSEIASLFSINTETGWITLLTQLDREKQEMYNLTVVASDSPSSTARKFGHGSPLTATTNVIITVTDFNDNPPRFERDSYSTSVDEAALPDTVLVRLVIKDTDTSPNSIVTYYITQGDELGQFGIRETRENRGIGELIVNKALDRESIDKYIITVAATDGTFVTYATVTIDVLDDNDNSPVCTEPFLKVELNENVIQGTQVTRIQATDADERETVNARIEYSLQGDGSDHFIIDKMSGLIRTSKLLDRETRPQFRLSAIAQDGGGLSCTASVLVSLKDVNDNPPVFGPGSLRESYSIQEDAPVHTLLTRIVARDADTGMNSHINYQLSSGTSSVFTIDPESGIISLVATLDRERNPSYDLTIIAFNPTAPDLSTEVTIKVLVLDVNDNPPEFEHSSYKTTLQESAEVGAVVKQVKATSLDIGVNADITYSLIAGNEQGKFAINPKTGVLTVAEPLDHELSREYFITVLATDRGTPPLTNTAVISINVTDINDNAPRFSQDAYSVHVSESITKGSELLKVMATDSDSLPNAMITYSILGGNTNNQFIIDPKNGILQVNAPLDREKISSYSLVIQAHDSGLPMLLSSAVVSITVDDTNDNPPLFSQDLYKGQVQEGRRTGIEIVTVSVSDADLPENSEPFTYEIVTGNENGEFHIDGGGVIRTAGKLSKKVQEKYILSVRAYDNGKPALFSDTIVEVEVVDESLYAPEIQDLSITIRSCVDNFPGGVIGRIQATDRDPYDRTIFSIVSPNSHLFDIHRYDGRLIALTGLDAGNYIVNVSISDGKFTTYGKVDIDVTCASKEMLENSLTIQFENMAEEQFYANFKTDFQKVLKQELDVRASDIEIINVQPSSESVAESRGARKTQRSRRSTIDNLDVLFAVHKPPDKFYNKKSLKWKIERVLGRIESALGAKIADLFFDTCHKASCEMGTCVGKIHFDESTLVPVLINGASFVSARHRYTEQCVCLQGQCAEQVCGDTMCSATKLCQKNAFGDYVCQCPEGRTGDMCETAVPLCSGSTCPIERPMTFAGKSYAKWKLQHSTKKRFSLKFRLRTRQRSGILMYAKGKVHYSILKIEKGSLSYIFDCGSGEGQVRIPVDLSDGQWHLIELDRHGREAELSLDSAYTAMGVAPGIHAILNVDSEEIYFGAEVDVFPNGYRDISHGFEGCMEDIRVFNIPLPFSGSNELAQAIEFEAVEFHCQDFPVRFVPAGNVCSSNPCLNGGQCKQSGVNSYACVCLGSYRGPKCELDPDPCRQQPCNNGGLCEVDSEVPNSVVCQCKNHLTGTRCTYGKFCRPNPCKQGGICVEGPNAPLCDCASGYQGLYCEKTADGCTSNPCLHGATCHNRVGGTYFCNCTSDYSGRNCELLVPDRITSSSSSLFIGLIAAGIVLLLIVFVVILCLLRRRHKRERQRHAMNVGLPESSSEAFLSALKDKRCKSSNPDLSVPVETIPCQPPPVPTRPASYTPSTHDSLNMLNNLDNIGNYGSAADDLENTGLQGHIPDYYQYIESYRNPSHSIKAHPILRVSPLPLGSRDASETGSIQKAHWEFEYPNILENYMEGDKKQHDKMAKQMPGMHSPHPSPAVSHTRSQGRGQTADINSVSSFNESEDDLNGYHWDTSDWAPGPSMPNISEIPVKKVLLHSPSSSQPSDDCNANADTFDDDNLTTRAIYNGDVENPLLRPHEQRQNNIDDHNIEDDENFISPFITSDQEQDYFEDSEYVGDSEYAENEPYERGDIPPSYAEHPRYEQLLPNLDDSYVLPGDMSIHPNKYLPKYNLSHQDLDIDPLTEDENLDGQPHKLIFASGNSPHIHDYPPLRPPKEFMISRPPMDRYTTNQGAPSRSSFTDDMSMSLGGLARNASSFSDISGLCEIVDSEMSATDTDDENTPCLSPGQLQTQV